jgi:putative SbcD/Mre11-related phosphoesterase
MHVLNDWALTPARAAIHLPTRTAVVADLHLGYAEARQRAGDAVPTTAVASILAPLRPALATYGARHLVIAGDLFESRPSSELLEELLDWFRNERIELTAVVPGNHDRGAKTDGLPIHLNGFDLGGWQVIHGDGRRPAGRVVQGHEHPLLRWGNGLAAPCYLVGNDHIVLPAFSMDAAGVSVMHATRWSAYRCCAIAGNDVLDFGQLAQLQPVGRPSFENTHSPRK